MDTFKPSPGLLAKLGSLIVHADEALGPDSHDFDIQAFRSGLEEPEVQAWLRSMNEFGLLPVKRVK